MTLNNILVNSDVIFLINSSTFNNVILKYIKRAIKRIIRCRLCDLLLLNIAIVNITLNDLRFDLFLKILHENIAFNAKIEFIYCKFNKTRTLECNIARL